jgi:hypothetical protein
MRDGPGLGHRAGPKTGRAFPRKPLLNIFMVDMVAPCQSDQDVEIQQVRFHGSSSAASVCSSVIGGASSGIEKRGKGARCSHGLRRKAARDVHASCCDADRLSGSAQAYRASSKKMIGWRLSPRVPRVLGIAIWLELLDQPNPKTGNQSRISAPQRLFASLLDRRKPNEIMAKGVNKDTGTRNAPLMSRRE